MRSHVSENQRSTRRMRSVATGSLAAILVIALALPQSALAQPKDDEAGDSASGEDEALYNCGKAKGKVSVSFKPEVELKDLITWAMGFTCKNFVYGAGIGGRSAKVTIIAPKKMTARQAWRVFLVALQTMGLTVVPKGNVNKIVEAKQSKGESLPLYRKGTPEAKSQLVRLVMRPEHIPVDDLATALNALKSGEGQVTTLSNSGIIVVTDYGDNIYAMKSLMREIDRAIVGERIYMIKVVHADATDLAAKLTEVLGTKETKGAATTTTKTTRTRKGKKAAATPKKSKAEVETAIPSKILADEGSNSLIILSNEAAYLRVRSLVKRLDVPMEGQQGGGRIHVYYLENADAQELGTTLNTVITGIAQPAANAQRGNQRQPAPRSAASAGSAPAFEGQVRVTHDKPTNSLIIVASVRDMQALKDVIEKLDLPRTQVFIEAVILEVTADSSLNLGTSFHGGKDLSDGSIVIGGAQHNDLRSLNVASLATQTGMLGGLVGPLLPNAEQLLGTSVPSYGVLFQALATSSNVNVLSSPHLLTTDNEPAEISVGENIPYQSSFSNFGLGGAGGQQGGGFGVPVQSVQRQDVALTLKITPHVNQSNMVRLEIDQEISDIASPDFAGLGPSWSKRSIKTTVVVGDQQTIVIGGLMQDKVTYSESKVPLLGDIPILGYLFKYTQKSKQKANLLVMLTPYIIKDQMDIEQIVQRKVRERDEFVQTFSNFARMTYRPEIDYRRKRGLVEEINHTMMVIERDEEILRELEFRDDSFPDGPVEYDPDAADDDDDDDAPAPPDGITDKDGGDDGKKAEASDTDKDKDE